MSALKKFISNIEDYIVWIVFTPLIGLMFLQVVARYCFGIAWGWMEQITRIMYVYVGFAGMSLVSKHKEHLRVSFVAEFAPGKWTKTIMYLIGDMVMVVVCAYLGFLISKMTLDCYTQHQVFSGATFIPVWTLYISGALGMFGVSIRTFLSSVLPAIKEIAHGGKDGAQTSQKAEENEAVVEERGE